MQEQGDHEGKLEHKLRKAVKEKGSSLEELMVTRHIFARWFELKMINEILYKDLTDLVKEAEEKLSKQNASVGIEKTN